MKKYKFLMTVAALLALVAALSLAACDTAPAETAAGTDTSSPTGEICTLPHGETVPPAAADTTPETDAAVAAPDFTVLDWEGNEVKLSDLKGTPVVLNFWASWCPPCKAEMPDFDAKAKENEGRVAFMMVNLTDGQQETVERAKSHVESSGYTFPVYFDTTGEAAGLYSVYSIPTTFFIDAEGNIETYYTGMMSAELLEIGIAMIRED